VNPERFRKDKEKRDKRNEYPKRNKLKPYKRAETRNKDRAGRVEE